MNDQPIHLATRRPVHQRGSPPHTWGGVALYVVFAALFPVTLFALAHPTVVAAVIAGVTAGLLARPLYRTLARRADEPRKRERQSAEVGPTATKD